MENINDIFISHKSEDNEIARELERILKEINPDWRIFLDCSEENPLEGHEQWRARMVKEVSNSKYLICLVSKPEYLKDGYGHVYTEVSKFFNLKATRISANRANRTISYFGIFMCPINFAEDLYNDKKGEEYKLLYEEQRHLILDNGETLEKAKERIKAKVLNMINEGDSGYVSELLDKTRAYAEEKKLVDPMFDEQAIDVNLLPQMSVGEKKGTNFFSLAGATRENNITILGNEGGAGKTAVMTKLFYTYLKKVDLHSDENPGMVPLYVDARGLDAENFLITRYLAKTLYDEDTAMTSSKTSETVTKLINEFKKETQMPQYLLLVDGYNEIPKDSKEIFDEEIKDFLPGGKYKNVRLVVSGRDLGGIAREDAFCEVELEPLSFHAIDKYLKFHKLSVDIENETLMRILSIPMFLKMYADTAAEEGITSKADLILKSVKRQLDKDQQQPDKKARAVSFMMLYHILPLIAHRMVMTDDVKSDFIITQEEIGTILKNDLELLGTDSYIEHFGEEYEKDLVRSDILNCRSFELKRKAIDYFKDVCKLLRSTETSGMEFVHQVYRDFFCSMFLAEDIKRTAGKERNPAVSTRILEKDVCEFTVELLKEKRAYYTVAEGRWNYSCNEESHLMKLLNSIRQEGQTKDAVLVANVVELLKKARNGDLSACDFSELDMTMCDLTTCVFFRRDKYGVYPASFRGARIDRRNLFVDNHFVPISAASVNEHYLATYDISGIIKFWENKKGSQNLVKTLTGVEYHIEKMLFSPQGDKIYAMTPYEIIEIAVPDEEMATAQVNLLYKSMKKLRAIELSESGEVYFTTIFNSFNPKPVSNPDMEDTCKFYGISSCASMSGDRKTLAFGYVADRYGLMIYDFNEEKNSWEERKFGYPQLLEQCILEMEAQLKEFGCYEAFPDENIGVAKKRASYFIHLQQQFDDRTHDHEKVTEYIVERILKELRHREVRLTPYQVRVLWDVARKHTRIIKEFKNKNPHLSFLSGRKITNVDFHKEKDLLLVSFVKRTKEYRKFFKEKAKRREKEGEKPENIMTESFVVEIDTTTMETRQITYHKGPIPVKAWYDGDDIIVNCYYKLKTLKATGERIMSLKTLPRQLKGLISSESDGMVYAVSYHFIYRIDKDGMCTGGYENKLKATKLSKLDDEEGNVFLAKDEDTQKSEDRKISAFNTIAGKCMRINSTGINVVPSSNYAQLGDIRFKTCGQKLVRFEGMQKADEMEIRYKLFVYGCDFTGVTGTMESDHNRRLLYKYGAKVDAFDVYEPQQQQEASFGFEASTVPFDAATKPKPGISVYTYHPERSIAYKNLYKAPMGGEGLFTQKTWNLIRWGFNNATGLEATDYSILEWVDTLSFASAGMIYDLVEAGLIAKSDRYGEGRKNLVARIAGTLHKSYKLLARRVFVEGEKERTEIVFEPSESFGKHILREIKETGFRKQAEEEELTSNDIRRILARNLWFCTTLRRHKENICDYGIEIICDTERHFEGRGKVYAYIKLGQQPFFAETVRKTEAPLDEEDFVNKVKRVCILSKNYDTLTGDGRALHLKKAPVVVIVGEDFEHCAYLNSLLGEVEPDIRKIFTYDSLIASDECAQNGESYFEFKDSTAFAVDIRTLL